AARPPLPAAPRRAPGAARCRGRRPPLRGHRSLLGGLRRVSPSVGVSRLRRTLTVRGGRSPSASADRDDRRAGDLLERLPVRVPVDHEPPVLPLAGDAALLRALFAAAQQAAGGALELELLLD